MGVGEGWGCKEQDNEVMVMMMVMMVMIKFCKRNTPSIYLRRGRVMGYREKAAKYAGVKHQYWTNNFQNKLCARKMIKLWVDFR